ncbi:MAG: C_GCAxxG_C_C family protein [Clostridia bacterium]|nr:C_GCAxxG_C_C family protein [Clostridia bacterium]
MKDYAKTAEELFKNGCNCSQAVLLAFSDVTGLDDETALKLASSFGGGMGRMREVCGAVSGALMVLGIAKGYSDLSDAEAKKEHYALVQEFARCFKEENGSIICRELLAGVKTEEGTVPEKRTDEYYKKRPCGELCFTAAKITEELLK